MSPLGFCKHFIFILFYLAEACVLKLLRSQTSLFWIVSDYINQVQSNNHGRAKCWRFLSEGLHTPDRKKTAQWMVHGSIKPFRWDACQWRPAFALILLLTCLLLVFCLLFFLSIYYLQHFWILCYDMEAFGWWEPSGPVSSWCRASRLFGRL